MLGARTMTPWFLINRISLSPRRGRAPRVMITDKLRSYAAAKRGIMPGVEHRSHNGLNNRAENSHQPIRRRERIMKQFKSPRHLQRFVSIHDPIANLFHNPAPRHLKPSSRTAFGGDEPVGENCQSMATTQNAGDQRRETRIAPTSPDVR
jgi:hypothetical protein